MCSTFCVNQNRLIFGSTNEQALRNFIDQGFEFGGQANLSAVAGGKGAMFGGAAAVAPGVYLDQLTNTGLSATVAGLSATNTGLSATNTVLFATNTGLSATNTGLSATNTGLSATITV